MCLAPVRIRPGVVVGCDACWACAEKRKADFVGRCLAEQNVSAEVLAVTLTYRGDSLHATSLYYKDVQLMLKRLRIDGFKLRYLCAGEHGEKKGRAHWHCILFFSGRVPDGICFERRFDWKYWPHGFCYMQNADYGGFRYLLKYTLKDNSQRAMKKKLRLSKYPPIGSVYFQHLAQRHAEAGLPLHGPEYSFSDVRVRDPKDGKYRPREFWLWDKSRELYLEHYVSSWRRLHGKEPPATPFLWENYFDPAARRERLLDREDLEASIARKTVEWQQSPKRREAPSWAELRGLLVLPGEVKGLVSRYSDGTARLVLGADRFELRAGPSLDAALLECGISSPELRGEVVAWVHAMPVRSMPGAAV